MRERAHLWILNGKVPEACTDIMRWAQAFETSNRRVAEDSLLDGDIWISTVFLGLDHCFVPGGIPILFETMVFGEPHEKELLGKVRMSRDDLEMYRYSTWEQAEAGHRNIVEIYRQRIAEAKAELERTIHNRGTVGQ